MNHRLFILVIFLTSAFEVASSSTVTTDNSISSQSSLMIYEYLKKVRDQSNEIQILSLQEKSNLTNAEIDLSQFDTTGYLGFSYTDSEDVPFSPFSSDSTERYEYSAGVSKLWNSGLETSLDYILVDNLTTFPARDNSEFISPDISLSLKTSLLRDIVGGSKELVVPEIKEQKKAITTQTKIQIKEVLAKSLLLLAEILDLQSEVELQKELCSENSQQEKKLKQKSKRRSVRNRDYLLSLKDYKTCVANLESLRNSLAEKNENLKVKYGVESSFYKRIEVSELFTAITGMYNSPNFSVEKADVKNRNNIIQLKAELEVLKIRSQRLRAEEKADLQFELKAGLRGLKDEFGESHEDITEKNFPYVIGSVRLEFPFTNRQAKINSQVNRFQSEVLNQKISQLEKEDSSRFEVLRQLLENNFSIYEKYKENVVISRLILSEARKDFENGQIDFFNLSEFQKNLIQSRRQLAQLRAQIVVQMVEYIDYFHFFDRYY